MENAAKIIKKIIFKVPIKTQSPLRIGSGQDDGLTDILILKDKDGIPFIPGTSLAGVLRSELQDVYEKENTQNGKYVADFLFGNIDEVEKERQQSLITVSDISFPDADIIHRDGVKIDAATGVGEKGAKYDYEVLDRGAKGIMRLEITVRNAFLQDETLRQIVTSNITKTRDVFCELAAVLADLITSGIQVGSLTAKGYGKISSIEAGTYYCFDFTKKEDVIAWLRYIDDGTLPAASYSSTLPLDDSRPIEIQKMRTVNDEDLYAQIYLSVKSVLLVRDYDAASNELDDDNVVAVQLQSNGQYVIPGTSIKGVIRHQAHHILAHFEYEDDTFENELFGFANQSEKRGQKSRIYIDEVYIDKSNQGMQEYLQTRNRIDRFTGGTVDGALFSEKPIYQPLEEVAPVVINMKIKRCKPKEAGLVLLIIKALWLGNLTVGSGGSIGRGVLVGKKCCIRYKGRTIFIKAGAVPFVTGNAENNDNEGFLEAFVRELAGEVNG